MDTLQIQDSFEPYFAGRKSFPQPDAKPAANPPPPRLTLAALRAKRDRLLPVRLSDIRSVGHGR